MSLPKYDYRKKIIRTINKLIKARSKVFGLVINLAFAKEYEDLSSSFLPGDSYEFTLQQFDGATDVNLQNLVKLCKLHDKTINSLIILNEIEDDEIDDF